MYTVLAICVTTSLMDKAASLLTFCISPIFITPTLLFVSSFCFFACHYTIL